MVIPPKFNPVEVVAIPIGIVDETIDPELVISTEFVEGVHALLDEEIVEAQLCADTFKE
jgi:hypothetical protein